MKKLLFFITLIFTFLFTKATDVTIGSGTSSSWESAFSGAFGYHRSANIYTSAEIGTTGVTITHLQFYVGTTDAGTLPIKIYLKTTASSTLSADTWSNLTSGATLVYDASRVFSSSGWVTIDITDFSYSSNNLLVLCESNFGGTGGVWNAFRYSSAANKHQYWEQDNSAPTGNGIVDGNRAQIIITYTSTSAPTVTTTSASSVTITTASSGGNVTSDGGSAITSRGVCWNTSTNPTTSNSKTTDAGTTGAYASSLTGLSAETYYYVRAYAINAIGTSYGSNVNLWTLSTEPNGQAAAFSAAVSSSSQIDLTFTAASTYGADGYIILRTTGAVAPTNTGVSDASAPGSLSLPGGTTLVTTITNNATTSYSNSGLSASTQYSYAIIPFNWNGTNSETYNYKTDGTIATCNGTTPFAPTVEGFQISGNLVNNGTLIQTDDENYFNMTGSSKSITGSGVYTNTKLFVTGSVTFDATISSGSFEKTYIDGTKSFTINNSKTYINGLLNNIGTLTLSASSIFKNSENFTNTGTLTADATSTVEFNGSAAQTITSDGDAFGNVTINNTVAPGATDGVILGDALNIQSSSVLTLTDGIIICNGKRIVVNNTAANAIAAGGANAAFNQSWIFGNSTAGCLRKYIADNTDTYIFPVGIATRANKAEFINNSLTDGAAFYIDAWFNSSPTNPNASFASLTEGGATYSSVHTDGVWVLDHSGVINGSYSLKLYFNGAFSGLEDQKFGILSRPTGSVTGADWTMAGTRSTTNASDGYVYRTGLNSFSEKGVGITDAVLPIELLSFDAFYNGKTVDVSWVTVSEVNNDYFVVERSDNNIHFTELETVDGAGNSNRILNYYFEDMNPLNGISYYRLKQVDFDGKYTYSNSISVINSHSAELEISLFPNPVSNEANILISGNSDQKVTIKLLSVSGVIMYTWDVDVEKGNHKIPVQIFSTLAEGVYFLEVSSDSFVKTLRVVVRR